MSGAGGCGRVVGWWCRSGVSAGVGARRSSGHWRWWPGATADAGEHLPHSLASPSEWLAEREWRVSGTGDPPALEFQWSDVAFLVAPDARWQSVVADFVADLGGAPYGADFMKIPVVVVSSDGIATDDPDGLWTAQT